MKIAKQGQNCPCFFIYDENAAGRRKTQSRPLSYMFSMKMPYKHAYNDFWMYLTKYELRSIIIEQTFAIRIYGEMK